MAGGEGTRWGNHLGVPKHLVSIEGETLLARQVRQLRDRGVADVVVLGPPDGDARYLTKGALLVPTGFHSGDTDKFVATMQWWTPKASTVIVYGDCWLSDTAMDRLTETPDDAFRFVGRENPSPVTGCPWGELFGVTVTPAGHEPVRQAIVHVRSELAAGRIPRGGGWEVYRATQGLDLHPDSHQIVGNFVDVSDWSDDFDFPDDLDRWVERRKAAGLQ